MARNIPPCEWIINSTYDLIEPNVEIDGQSCTIDVNTSCSDCLFYELTDPFVYSLIFCYSIILTLGFFGNLAVIAIILSVRELRIVINLLLVALAFSDLLITIAMPFSFLSNISYEYRASEGICKGIPLLQGTAIMSGIYTLVVIAWERYYVIVHPFKSRILNNPKRIALCIATIWLISACLQVPLAVVLAVEEIDVLLSVPDLEVIESCSEVCVDASLRLCIETWSLDSALAFSYVVLIVMYILPLVCISSLYYKIGRTMWKRRPVGNSSSKEVALYKQKRRLITFLIVLVVTFAVLWGPYFIIHCLREPIANRYLWVYLQVMGQANVAVNPILYAYFHRNVRKQAVIYIRRASVLIGVKPSGRKNDIVNSVSEVGGHSRHDQNDSKLHDLTSIQSSKDKSQSEENSNRIVGSKDEMTATTEL